MSHPRHAAAPSLRGVSFLGSWGLLHDDFDRCEHVILYEADMQANIARPLFRFAYDSPEAYEPGRICQVDPAERIPVSEDLAVPPCSVAGDLRVTRVVDGIKGPHMALRRDIRRPARSAARRMV